MRLFKPTYKDGKGKTKTVNKWWVELKDHNDITRRFAGFPDKTATEETGRNIERLISFRSANLPPDAQLVRWLEKIPRKLESRLAQTGLLSTSRIAANKSLLEHITDFKTFLALHGKEKHVNQAVYMLKEIVGSCGFNFWSDVRASDIEAYLVERRKQGLSKQSVAYYAKAFRHFGRWMVKEKRASEAPVIHYEKPPKIYGRAFGLDEFRKLLDATITGPQIGGLSGGARFLCYVLAVETGLRRGELCSLTPASFDFKANTVFVSGEHTKNNEDAIQEFSAKTAELLKGFIANKMPNVRLFPLSSNTAAMIQADCKATGIEVVDNRGRSLNFHSLRHSCGTFLADKGVHPKVIQTIMRHKDINLTMNRYCHVLEGQRRKAVESLPDFETRKATGTESA